MICVADDMSEKYIKSLEERIKLMESIIEYKDKEILKANKGQYTEKSYIDSIKKSRAMFVDSNSFKTTYTFKFSLYAEDIQDIFSMYDGDEAVKLLEEMIINATKDELCEIEKKAKQGL